MRFKGSVGGATAREDVPDTRSDGQPADVPGSWAHAPVAPHVWSTELSESLNQSLGGGDGLLGFLLRDVLHLTVIPDDPELVEELQVIAERAGDSPRLDEVC